MVHGSVRLFDGQGTIEVELDTIRTVWAGPVQSLSKIVLWTFPFFVQFWQEDRLC